MNKQKKRKRFVLPLLLLVICFLLPVFNFNITYADNSTYSNVLEDLQKDENFNVEKYPVVEKDYSLKVIQIAESENEELFVYVYQTSGKKEDIRATTINISTGIDNDLDYHNYKLQYLNSYETLYKYKVENFEIKFDRTRYYDISSIFRSWNKNMDEPAENGNVINEISFAVSKCFVVNDYGETLKYSCFETETIEITDKYVGFLRYQENWTGTSLDNHFVAFSTNKDIKRLIEADVVYSSQIVEDSTYLAPDFGKIEEENYSYITYLDKTIVNGSDGWFSHWTYELDKIQSIKDFKATENRNLVFDHGIYNTNVQTKITDEGLKKLENKQWVLRFADTEYKVEHRAGGMGGSVTYKIYTIIANVSILRLKFETDVDIFNLGVVDNKQTGDGKQDNEENITHEIFWWKILLIILGSIFALIVLIFIVPIAKLVWFVLKIISKPIWWVLKGIWYVLTLPLEIFD